MRIGFTGNRYGITAEQKIQIKAISDKYSHTGKGITVSHGDCVGADTEFHNLCVEYKADKKITIWVFPPSDSKLRAFNKGDQIMPEKHYLKRNLDILKNSDILIACPVDKNKEICQAKKRGLVVYVF